MSIKVREIMNEMESIAPSILKEDFDNVGLMVGDEDKDIQKVLLALDCTKKVIEEAKRLNCDMIITHHPLIFRKPSRIIKSDLLGWKIIELIKNDISLYSSHTNLDSVENGINDLIVNRLGFNEGIIIEKSSKLGYENAGLGRLVKLEQEIDLDTLTNIIKEKLELENMRIVKGKKTIKNIAIINGSGQDFISKAVSLGADCIITGDTTYHFASDFEELGITIIDPGHFKTEWLTFLDAMERLKDKFKEVEFIKSKESKDPYKFI